MFDLSNLLVVADHSHKHAVTLFKARSLRSPRSGKVRNLTTAELAGQFADLAVATPAICKLDLPYWMPAVSDDGSHKAAHVTSHAALVVLDCDADASPALFDALASVDATSIWTESPTSSAAKPKGRPVLVLDRPLTGPTMFEDHRKIVAAGLYLASIFDKAGQYDTSTADISRVFFAPGRCILSARADSDNPTGIPCPDAVTPRSVLYHEGRYVLSTDAMITLGGQIAPTASTPLPVSTTPKTNGAPRQTGTGTKSVVVVPDDYQVTIRDKGTRALSTIRIADIPLGANYWWVAPCHNSDGLGAAFVFNPDGKPVGHCGKCGITTYTQSGSNLRQWQQATAKAAEATQTPALPPQATPEEQARHEALLALADDPKYGPMLASLGGHKAGQDLLQRIDTIYKIAKTQAKALRKVLPQTGVKCCIAATQICAQTLHPSVRRMACTTRTCDSHGARNILLAHHSAWRLPIWDLDTSPLTCIPRPDIRTLPPALIERDTIYAMRVRPGADADYLYDALAKAHTPAWAWDLDWTDNGPKIVKKFNPATESRMMFDIPDGEVIVLSTTPFDCTPTLRAKVHTTQPDTANLPDGTLPSELAVTLQAVQLTGLEAFRLVGPHMLASMHPKDTGIEVLGDAKPVYKSTLPRHSQTVTLALGSLTKLLPKTKFTAAVTFGYHKVEALKTTIDMRQGEGPKAQETRTTPPKQDEYSTDEPLAPEQADSNGTHWLSTEVRQPATPAILDHRFALAGTKKLRTNLDALVAPDLDAVHAAIDNL